MKNIVNSPEHKQMIKSLAELPQHPVLWTKDQGVVIENQKRLWQWTAKSIDYLQQKQLGCEPLNPLDNPELHSLQRKLIEVNSCYQFSQLNLIIVGWDLIKKAAQGNNRNFPFNNPRELFTEVCRQQVTFDIKDIVTGEGEDDGIGKVRKKCSFRITFYREKLEVEETEKMLEMGRKSECWENFIIYAIWKKKNSSDTRANFKIRDCWKSFLSAYKNLTAFWCSKTPVDRYKLILPKWNSGYAVNPQTSRRINW
jgi:hypothetical protein